MADAIINPLVILSVKRYDIMSRLRLKKKREDSVPQMWCNCGFIEKARYEENISVAFDQSIILPITFAKGIYYIHIFKAHIYKSLLPHGSYVIRCFIDILGDEENMVVSNDLITIK